jgi:hypothetical protein
MSLARQSGIFGSRVVGAAFVLAVLGWGTGFYGPPIYGVSIGGVVFSPLWAAGIALLRALPMSALAPAARSRLGWALWRDPKFLTLSAGMALGLFAQIGLITHLFSLLGRIGRS